MTTEAVHPPPLPTEIFFQAVRSYRNGRTFGMIATALLGASPFTSAAIHHLLHPAEYAGMLPVPLLYLLSVFFLLSAGIQISNCLRNVREPITIDSTSIRWKHNFWFWSQIKSIAPAKVNFAKKYFVRVGLLVDPRVCLLQPDEALTPRQYSELIAKLRDFLGARLPAIQLTDAPR